ncbi:MAG: hypothetical protein ABIF40_04425 [archaeon]
MDGMSTYDCLDVRISVEQAAELKQTIENNEAVTGYEGPDLTQWKGYINQKYFFEDKLSNDSVMSITRTLLNKDVPEYKFYEQD